MHRVFKLANPREMLAALDAAVLCTTPAKNAKRTPGWDLNPRRLTDVDKISSRLTTRPQETDCCVKLIQNCILKQHSNGEADQREELIRWRDDLGDSDSCLRLMRSCKGLIGDRIPG